MFIIDGYDRNSKRLLSLDFLFLLYLDATFVKVINRKSLTNSGNSKALIYSVATKTLILIDVHKSKFKFSQSNEFTLKLPLKREYQAKANKCTFHCMDKYLKISLLLSCSLSLSLSLLIR